jgi:hypothetical protein
MWIMFHKILYTFLSILTLLALSFNRHALAACPPADASRFGVVEQLTWRFLYSPETLPTALTMMRDAGIQWVRLNWSWKDMQPKEGAFHFDQFDPVAEAAADYDIHLLPILVAVPAWASTAPADLIAERGSLSPVDKYRPRQLEDWLTYVRTVVERYDGDGVDDAPGSPRMDYWEVWNEPNLSLYWPPTPDVEEYFNLLKPTYATIKEADPTAKVVMGGLSGSGVNAEGTGYLQQFYRIGGGDYFDVVSVHQYIHPAISDNVERIQASLEAVRGVMDKNGDADVPLWLTEVGWSDAPDAWGQPTASQEEVAAFLKRLYTAPLPADKIFWYNFRNVFDGSPDAEHNFGLIHNDYTPKPSYEAYAEVAGGC